MENTEKSNTVVLLLKASITLEQAKAQIKILQSLLSGTLDTIENKFESDEAAFNYEQMKSYVEASNYLYKKLHRPGMQRRFLERMNRLPY